MAKVNKKLEKSSAHLLKLAGDFNFFGKRLRDTKLECAEKMLEMAGTAGIESGELVDWLDQHKPAAAKREKSGADKPAASTMIGSPDRPTLEIMDTAEIVIVVAAQNNTELKPEAWQAVQRLSSELNAQIVVMPNHYNKTAFSAAKESEREFFAEPIRPYLLDRDVLIFDGLVKLAPSAAGLVTDKLPVNAAAQVNSGERFTIAPHPKQQMRTLVRMLDQPIRQAWTTGTITGYNYTRSRAGGVAQADHAFGCLVLFRTHGGGVQCTNVRFSADGSYAVAMADEAVTAYAGPDDTAKPVVVLGDLHCEMKDHGIYARTIDLLCQLDPAVVVLHDVIHFSTMSHHNRNNSAHLYRTKDQTVRDDLAEVIYQLTEIAECCEIVYLCESNHNSAVDHWLNDQGFKPDSSPQNAKLYHLLKYLVCEAIDNDDQRPAWVHALINADLTGLPALPENVIFGQMDKPYVVYGFDYSQHGHKGNNGSAGNHNQLSRAGLSLVTGHTHSPAITARCLTVGVSAKLDQGYNRGGGSSWANSHAIVWPNGEAQIVNLNF